MTMTRAQAERIARDDHHVYICLLEEDDAFQAAWDALPEAERERWRAQAAEARRQDDADLEARAKAPGANTVMIDLDIELQLPVEAIARALFRDAWTPPEADHSDAAADALWMRRPEQARERDIARVLEERDTDPMQGRHATC